MMFKSLGVHLGLLILGSVVAVKAWTSEDQETNAASIELWKASPDQLSSVEFHSAKTNVVLESKKDDLGRYFVGSIDKEIPSVDPHKRPPDHPPEKKKTQSEKAEGSRGANAGGSSSAEEEASAGAGGSSATSEDTPEKESAPEHEKRTFIAVTEANKLAETLAELKGKRALGKLPQERYEEFGFGGDDEGKLKIAFGTQVHELTLGGPTPGSGDVYVRLPDGNAYVMDGSIARDIQSADARLMQRNFRQWDKEDAKSVVLQTDSATRELVRTTDQSSFWSSPDTPTEKDETASNWMSKLLRLRISTYVDDPALQLEALVRVEFKDQAGKSLGYVELTSRDKPGEERKQYLARSGLSRWYGIVLASSGEQLTQDLTSVMSE